ncbi:putative F-box domain-containing protein [Medicago truncatula]|uniref:Putative F-box domain-containing protein n=1 Tax=Medicago truncatula TaxID=3880 RepID=A0A396H7B7_MEDTR|nr:putative F-box domain-containing protein [Medicago truncatula]
MIAEFTCTFVQYNRRAAAEVKRDNLELQTWADLPAEVLELFLSRLDVGDNIRASAVCKRWCSVATSVRVVDQSPRLMYFPKIGNFYDFYDPMQRKTIPLSCQSWMDVVFAMQKMVGYC